MTLPTTTTLNDCEPDDSDMFGPPRSSPPPSHHRIDCTNGGVGGGYHSHRSRVPMISPKLRQREERKRILQLCAHKLERIKDSETNLRRSVCINNTYCRLNDELRREKQSRYLANLPKSESKPETARDNIFNPYNSCSLDNSNHQLISAQHNVNNNVINNNNNHKSNNNSNTALSTAASNVDTTNYHQRQQSHNTNHCNDDGDIDSDEDIIDVDDGYLNNNSSSINNHNNNSLHNLYNSNNNNNTNNSHCDIKSHHHHQQQTSSLSCLGHEGQLGHVQQKHCNYHHHHHNNNNNNQNQQHNRIHSNIDRNDVEKSNTQTNSTASTPNSANAHNNMPIASTQQQQQQQYQQQHQQQRRKRQLSSSNFDTDLERLDRELNAINAPMPLIDPEITQGAEQLEKAISSRKRLRSEDESDRLVREALSQFYIPPQRFISAIEDCPLDVVGVTNANCLSMGNISPKRQKLNAPDLELDFDVNQNSKDFEVIMDALRLSTPSPTPSMGSDSCGQAAMMSEAASVFHNLVVTSLET